ncbi:phosphotransferase [Paenibacillus profundus]|uniref:Phosphotransferase n=1 Tax=Paenibacillus profundus TaxID=1173085 RepID=A0ABS8YGC8_9BACL|nr:phosphotransferase [Paenibacillus profundus]MCE5170831.1 phosphotransferase [Paenibacillus profundus]
MHTKLQIYDLAKDAVDASLKQYNLDIHKIYFLGRSEHVTYRIDTYSNESYLLRIHTNELRREEIESELVWLEHLSGGGLQTPRGMKNNNGQYVTEVEIGEATMHATLLVWVKGQSLQEQITLDDVAHVGQLMAKLHERTTSFQSGPEFVRPVWGEDSLRKDVEKLGRHYFDFMTDGEFERVQEIADKICARIHSLAKTGDTYGVIHADLHWENIVHNNGEPRAIDFGRCGFGFYLYDIAQSLMGQSPQGRKAFIDGYAKQRPLPADYEDDLESFFIMAVIENTSFHSDNPEELEHLKSLKNYLMKVMDRYLEGESFLFGN